MTYDQAEKIGIAMRQLAVDDDEGLTFTGAEIRPTSASDFQAPMPADYEAPGWTLSSGLHDRDENCHRTFVAIVDARGEVVASYEAQ